jgi:lipid-A-disaccharide synthase
VPEVVCYQGNFISYLLARLLIKVKFISLVNLIMDRKIVEELIQSDLNEKRLRKELKLILEDKDYRQQMLKNMDELAEKLGGQGASERTAALMITYLKA